MNILIEKLPHTVEVEGVEYAINADFRTFLKFDILISNKQIEEEEKILEILELCYPIIPENIQEAIQKMIWFYACGNTKNETSGTNEETTVKKIYCFEQDAEYIYSAFLEQYKIDLQEQDNLHWWRFKALFDGLSEETQIRKIMGYRSMDLNKIKDKEQKKFYNKMQKLYKIEEKLTTEQKEELEYLNTIFK